MTRKSKSRLGHKPRSAHDKDVDPPPNMANPHATHDAPPEPVEAPPRMTTPEPPLLAPIARASEGSPSKPQLDMRVIPSTEKQNTSATVATRSSSSKTGNAECFEQVATSEAKLADSAPPRPTESTADRSDSPRHHDQRKRRITDDVKPIDTLRHSPTVDTSELKRETNDVAAQEHSWEVSASPLLPAGSAADGMDADMPLKRSPSIFRMQDASPGDGSEDGPPTRSIQPVLAPDVAQRVVRHILFDWIKRAVPLRQLFPPSPSASCLCLDAFASTLQHANVVLKPIEVAALLIAFPPIPPEPISAPALNVSVLVDTMSAKLFHVELLEFQLRKVVVAKSTKARGKCDVFKTVNQLVDTVAMNDNCVSVANWRTILVEKLALTCPQWVAVCVFCRVLAAPLAEMSPRAHFVTCLDRFVRNVQFDTLSVEGAFRSLVQDADFERGFRAIDTDGSGSLSLAECTTYLESMHHVSFPPAILQDFLRRFDRDGDGSLNLDEFMACCRPKQHTGVHILSPYGFFYMATDPMELAADVVARIHKRLFWLQHNHLVGASHASQATDAKGKSKLTVDPTKISICRHFGAVPLQYNHTTDTVQMCFSNGELLVLFEADSGGNQGIQNLSCKERHAIQRPPPLRPPELQLPGTSMADSARTAFDDVDIASPRSLPPFRAAVSDQPKPKRNLPKKAHATVPTIQLPTNVATWTRMHVKKWLIYTVQVKTVAPKLAAVDGAMLAEWATDTHLDMRLRDAYSITQPVHRLRLATHIRALRPQRAIDTNRREKVDDDKDLYEMPIDVETRSSTSCVQGDAITDSQPMQVASAVEIAPTTQFSSSAPDAPTHADDSVVGKRRVGCVMDETEPCARGGSVGERSNDATGLDKVDDEGDECLPSFSDAFIALEDDGRGSPPPPFDDALPGMEDL